MDSIETINQNTVCYNQIFTSDELKELLVKDKCKKDDKVIEIINRYGKGYINLDEALAEILVSYFECNNKD
ncbi:hypothetical protein JW865_01885 [Candidatus Bathyarchaeota archaeon]|nr:hypothetical protein [Candidatus Bathyarchaeota archaeon]